MAGLGSLRQLSDGTRVAWWVVCVCVCATRSSNSHVLLFLLSQVG